ncbi:MAG: alpha-ketoacid dehydrogenase subunit beta, partial [Ktedonobacteraceae bacterium]|nr:alpha-ketoacid dehydrogenase subunit beta [Ktedonobacteraceae bacterium]
MIEALNQELSLELERDPRVVLLGQDIGVNGGVFRVTEQLQQRFGETRVFDTPLSESGIIGTSVGMA